MAANARPSSRNAPPRRRAREESNLATRLATVALVLGLFGGGLVRGLVGPIAADVIAIVGLGAAIVLSLVALVKGPKRLGPAAILLFTCAFIAVVFVPNYQRARARAAQPASAPAR